MLCEQELYSKRKRTCLTVKQKLELIARLESGATVNQVCTEYDVKKQTVSDIRKNKEKLKQFLMKYNGVTSLSFSTAIHRKHMKESLLKDLENEVYKWFDERRSTGYKVTGSNLRNMATALAQKMGFHHFKASEGWLCKFRKRHGIGQKNVVLESYENFENILKAISTNESVENVLSHTDAKKQEIPSDILEITDTTVQDNDELLSDTKEDVKNVINYTNTSVNLEEMSNNVAAEDNRTIAHVSVKEEPLEQLEYENVEFPDSSLVQSVGHNLDCVMDYVTSSSDSEIQSYYNIFANFRKLLIKKQIMQQT